jgi:hypothetical protein
MITILQKRVLFSLSNFVAGKVSLFVCVLCIALFTVPWGDRFYFLDFFFTQQQFNFLEKSATGGAFTDFKDRIGRMKFNQFFGSYSISPELEKFLQSQKTVIPFVGGVVGDAVPLKMEMSEAVTDEREEIMNDEDISDEPSSNIRRTSARAATNEKVEVRKRWIALLGKIGPFLDSFVSLALFHFWNNFLSYCFFFSFLFLSFSLSFLSRRRNKDSNQF